MHAAPRPTLRACLAVAVALAVSVTVAWLLPVPTARGANVCADCRAKADRGEAYPTCYERGCRKCPPACCRPGKDLCCCLHVDECTCPPHDPTGQATGE
jgi:hypothetical protein